MQKIDHALLLAAKGFHVFRLQVNGKKPFRKGWQEEATRNPFKIKKLWNEAPDANIGIFTEKFKNGAALVVIDVDVKNGKDGEKSLDDLEADGCIYGSTLEQKTLSGGRHIIFSNEIPCRQGVDVLGEGLDIRSDGGYIAAAGSTIDGKIYEFINDLEIRSAPIWLQNKLTAPSQKKKNKAVDPSVIDIDNAKRRAAKYLLNDAPKAYEYQGGNATTYKVAAHIRDLGVNEDMCLDLMNDFWNPFCDPPWEYEELEQTIKNSYNFAKGDFGALAMESIFSPVIPENSIGSLNRLRPIHWSSLSTLPKKQSLIKNVLDKGGTSLVYGDSNSGKTFFALNIASSVAQGIDWHGRKTLRGTVVYIAAEGGLGLAERLDAIQKRQRLNKSTPLKIIPSDVDLCNANNDIKGLLKELSGIPDLALVAIDTFNRTMSGGDENSSKDMGSYIKNIEAIRKTTKAHVMIIHHPGKDITRGARGHNSLRAAVETEIEIVGSGKIVCAEIKKQRDGKTGCRFSFELEVVSLGLDEDGEETTSCILKEIENSPLIKNPSNRETRALNILKFAMEQLSRNREFPNYPNSISCISIKEFRQALEKGNISIVENPESRRKAISRIIEKLNNSGLTESFEDYIWPSANLNGKKSPFKKVQPDGQDKTL